MSDNGDNDNGVSVSSGREAMVRPDAIGSVFGPSAVQRFLPGLFPPPGGGVEATERRVVLALLLAIAAFGTAAAATLTSSIPVLSLELGWLVALGGVAVPWHRLPRAAFGFVAVAWCAVVAGLVAVSGGADSPFSGLFYLAVMLGCVTVPPWWLGVGLGVLAGSANLLPITYAHAEPDALLVRSGLLVATSLFGSWLVDELTRVAGVAKVDRRRLDEEQQTAAELRRMQSLRQEYMSVVAHELRNPLVAIGAAARVVAKDLQGRPNETLASGIVSEVRHALDLLDGLTDVSSLESGRLRIVLAEVDLSALVQTCAQGVAADREVIIRGADRPITVLADENRIGQVLRNLLGNAAKYTPADAPIEVTVGVTPDRRRAVVAVRDHGPGVPPLERARLFERFSRLSTAGGTRGSGLGLYISRSIVRDHQGELVADWPSGGGTVFTFTLPLAFDRAAQRRPAS